MAEAGINVIAGGKWKYLGGVGPLWVGELGEEPVALLQAAPYAGGGWHPESDCRPRFEAVLSAAGDPALTPEDFCFSMTFPYFPEFAT
jgi:hypothetical protein